MTRASSRIRRRARAVLRNRRRLAAAWRRLPRPERRAAATFALLIPLAAMSIRLWGFYRTYSWLEHRRQRQRATPTAESSVLALRRASQFGLYRGNCLSQSLVLWWHLRRAGMSTSLRIGARMEDGRFTAHAWVERDGEPLNDVPDVGTRFAPFQALEADRARTWS